VNNSVKSLIPGGGRLHSPRQPDVWFMIHALEQQVLVLNRLWRL